MLTHGRKLLAKTADQNIIAKYSLRYDLLEDKDVNSMTDEMQQENTVQNEPAPFGKQLQSTREAVGLACNEAAHQLRLSEKVILMMETDSYPTDLPFTFIRGYLQSYCKLLEIPDEEVKNKLEIIKQKHNQHSSRPVIKNLEPISNNNLFMPIFTAIILLTMIALVGVWWYKHSTSIQSNLLEANALGNDHANTIAATLSQSTTGKTAVETTTPIPETKMSSDSRLDGNPVLAKEGPVAPPITKRIYDNSDGNEDGYDDND